jgi:hypothetical protein
VFDSSDNLVGYINLDGEFNNLVDANANPVAENRDQCYDF